MNRKRKPAQIFEELERIANILPTPIYWLDTKGIVLGANDLVFTGLGGLDVRDKIIGKEHDSFYPKDVADTLTENNNKVIQLGQTIEFEEKIVNVVTGEVKYLTSIRSPLRDDNGNIIGIIGTSIDITDRKEKERLEIQNKELEITASAQQSIIQEQEKFRKRAEQLAHDINSPLASLRMLAEVYTDMPENYRLLLRKANDRIQDIAYDLIRDYKPKKVELEQIDDQAQPTLVSALLFEILSEKRAQYLKLPVTFSHKFNNEGNFAFIKINRIAFARSISNIINNSVDAFEGKREGHVIIHLDADEDYVKITIQDNGKGMPEIIKEKLLNYEVITSGKKNGHGIGYTQILDTISDANGSLNIDTQLGKGTSVILLFPRIESPNWIIHEINLGPKDIVVVLDDDPSIHDAWRARFNQIVEEVPGIHVEHFTQGVKALEFFEDLKPSAKQRLFLLSDYELLKQDLTGLQIIQYSGIKRAILVTSHYLNVVIRQEAMSIGVKLLPKQLTSAVAINIGDSVISKKDVPAVQRDNKIKKAEVYKKATFDSIVDLVLLDDDKLLVENLVTFMFKNMKVDTYYIPEDLLKNISKYSKNTKFVLDYNCGTNMSGIDLAKILHEKGYMNLFILSGEDTASLNCGDYATAILKTDLDSVRKYLVKK